MIQWIHLTVSKNDQWGRRDVEWQDGKTIFNIGHIVCFEPDGSGALITTSVQKFHVKESVAEIQLDLNGMSPSQPSGFFVNT